MIGDVAQLMEARNLGSVLVVDKGDFLTGTRSASSDSSDDTKFYVISSAKE